MNTRVRTLLAWLARELSKGSLQRRDVPPPDIVLALDTLTARRFIYSCWDGRPFLGVQPNDYSAIVGVPLERATVDPRCHSGAWFALKTAQVEVDAPAPVFKTRSAVTLAFPTTERMLWRWLSGNDDSRQQVVGTGLDVRRFMMDQKNQVILLDDNGPAPISVKLDVVLRELRDFSDDRDTGIRR